MKFSNVEQVGYFEKDANYIMVLLIFIREKWMLGSKLEFYLNTKHLFHFSISDVMNALFPMKTFQLQVYNVYVQIGLGSSVVK